MSRTEPSATETTSRGLLARPLEALVFLLPLMGFYEVASLAHPDRVIAFDLLRGVFELFGPVGVWLPGLLVVVILLATHLASRQAWKVRWSRVGWMYVEAAALAAPLLLFNWAVPQLTAGGGSSSLIDTIAMGIGAGVYEELVFRLILISVLVMIGVDLFHFGRAKVAVAAILLSALVFAAHHHQPVGMEPFDAMRFFFRTIAGIYLAVVFWYRGYGPAAGCHAAYNTVLALFGVVGA